MSDTLQFIKACLAGDTSSWGQVRSIALKFLRSHKNSQADDHADIIQNVIIKLLRGFRSFSGTTEKELRQYINVTTMREAVTHHRKNARLRSHDSIDQTPDDEASDRTLRNLLPDNRLDPATVSVIQTS